MLKFITTDIGLKALENFINRLFAKLDCKLRVVVVRYLLSLG